MSSLTEERMEHLQVNKYSVMKSQIVTFYLLLSRPLPHPRGGCSHPLIAPQCEDTEGEVTGVHSTVC